MNIPMKSTKTRLKVAFGFAVTLIIALILRLGYLQIYKGDELQKSLGTMDQIHRY